MGVLSIMKLNTPGTGTLFMVKLLYIPLILTQNNCIFTFMVGTRLQRFLPPNFSGLSVSFLYSTQKLRWGQMLP